LGTGKVPGCDKIGIYDNISYRSPSTYKSAALARVMEDFKANKNLEECGED
jgi:hypothetical protein